MTPKEQQIAIAEFCGWSGVPCEQQWKLGSRGKKYWQSVTPVEIIDELKTDDFPHYRIARWLRMPNGKPYISRKQPAGMVNDFMAYRDRPIVQDFRDSEWKELAMYGANFQYDPWPVVNPSLEYFVEYLPDYLNDLNACHEMEKVLRENRLFHKYWLALGEFWKGNNTNFSFHATAAQRCEAFSKTIGKWKDED